MIGNNWLSLLGIHWLQFTWPLLFLAINFKHVVTSTDFFSHNFLHKEKYFFLLSRLLNRQPNLWWPRDIVKCSVRIHCIRVSLSHVVSWSGRQIIFFLSCPGVKRWSRTPLFAKARSNSEMHIYTCGLNDSGCILHTRYIAPNWPLQKYKGPDMNLMVLTQSLLNSL